MQMIITIPRMSPGFFSKERARRKHPNVSRDERISTCAEREKTNKRLAEGVILQLGNVINSDNNYVMMEII